MLKTTPWLLDQTRPFRRQQVTKQHYDHPVYWRLPDDGALFKCAECEQRFKHDKVILTQIPKDDSRTVLCLECVDPYWLEIAKDLGIYPD